MKKSYWLSYDLGIKGDYDNLYSWLAKLEAVECGESLAHFTLNIGKGEDPKQAIENKLKEQIELSTKDRIYIIWREGSRVRGSFIYGSRKTPPWAGYEVTTPTIDEST